VDPQPGLPPDLGAALAAAREQLTSLAAELPVWPHQIAAAYAVARVRELAGEPGAAHDQLLAILGDSPPPPGTRGSSLLLRTLTRLARAQGCPARTAAALAGCAAACPPPAGLWRAELGLWQGHLLVAAGRPAEAVIVLRAAVDELCRVPPLHFAALVELLGALAAAGATSEAVHVCREAVSTRPERAATFRASLAGLLVGQGDPVGAEQEARLALAAAPDLAPAWLHLGQALLAQGRRDEACLALGRAGDLDPELAALAASELAEPPR